MKIRDIILFFAIAQMAIFTTAQDLNYDIRLNQIGFLPNSVKLAAVVNTQADSYKVMTSDLQSTV